MPASSSYMAEAMQLARETSVREASGKDTPKFASLMLAGANSIHSFPTGDLKEDDEEEGKPAVNKEKRKPLAERLKDTYLPYT